MRAVLMYHSLDDSGSPISVAPAAFERHLDWMTANHVQTPTFSEFTGGSSAGPALSLTFDDAFANFATEAWPRLRDRNLNATLYVVSGRCGKTNLWEGEAPSRIPELPLLDWDELARLAEEGCELGCHTHNHQHLTELHVDRVAAEIAESLDLIEKRTGQRPTSLAYPFGSYDQEVSKIANQHVKSACTTEFSLVTDQTMPMEIPRIDAWYFSQTGLLESFGSSQFANFVKRRRFLRKVKRVLPIFRD
ncbi:MAG: peptidoglycan/xylan/chitin deacetylase (PgdA/CDA1 family) [Planctomycetota bacterium]|jgi:peptidoglycan/xylan/chitin deacetylase (PgdA/CDA1 family)